MFSLIEEKLIDPQFLAMLLLVGFATALTVCDHLDAARCGQSVAEAHEGGRDRTRTHPAARTRAHVQGATASRPSGASTKVYMKPSRRPASASAVGSGRTRPRSKLLMAGYRGPACRSRLPVFPAGGADRLFPSRRASICSCLRVLDQSNARRLSAASSGRPMSASRRRRSFCQQPDLEAAASIKWPGRMRST